ncbi:Hypothetical_protein [Hexamita inflata]|uniref:Hypothetical_protein n=1 Tax=Hexamita inflata TaxID=28002 RepID=A0AA86UPN6_9EUKA|nr:Hypothetical protein HINF_LOCUS47417 [Hexamita inflata]
MFSKLDLFMKTDFIRVEIIIQMSGLFLVINLKRTVIQVGLQSLKNQQYSFLLDSKIQVQCQEAVEKYRLFDYFQAILLPKYICSGDLNPISDYCATKQNLSCQILNSIQI